MKTSSNLLINESPLMVLPSLVMKFGLNGAIVLQQIHYWLDINRKKKDATMLDGRFWTYNSYQDWQKQFPWWSVETIKRIILKLEDQKVLISCQPKAKTWDHTKYYSIDYDQLENVLDRLDADDPTDGVKDEPSKDSTYSNLDLTETPTETTTEINTKKQLQQSEKIEKRPDIFLVYEQELGLLTPMISEELRDIEKTYPEGWFKRAVKEARKSAKGGISLKYVEAILKRWKSEGLPQEKPSIPVPKKYRQVEHIIDGKLFIEKVEET